MKPVEECLAREVLCSVEAHVLKEVGQTVLVVFLLEGSDVGGEIELCPLCRLVIVTDIIGHAVLKLSDLYLRIVRKRCLTERRRCSEYGCNENK